MYMTWHSNCTQTQQAARKAKRRAEEAALLEGNDDGPANKLQKLFDEHHGEGKRVKTDKMIDDNI